MKRQLLLFCALVATYMSWSQSGDQQKVFNFLIANRFYIGTTKQTYNAKSDASFVYMSPTIPQGALQINSGNNGNIIQANFKVDEDGDIKLSDITYKNADGYFTYERSSIRIVSSDVIELLLQNPGEQVIRYYLIRKKKGD